MSLPLSQSCSVMLSLLPDGELRSTVPNNSPLLDHGCGCEMALSRAYISSALQDILINGKKNYTAHAYVSFSVLFLQSLLLRVIVSSKGNCPSVLQTACCKGFWFCFVGFGFFFCLFVYGPLLCSHSIILLLCKEVR